jgi:quercetin dioxygenase-like cupin family protein
MTRKIILGVTAATLAIAGVAIAQQAGVKRTPLQKIDFPAGYNTVTGIAEIPAGGAAGRHTHPGVEAGYILEGEVEFLVEGQPPRTLKAGDSYQVLEGVAHDAKVIGDKAAKVLGTYVVKAGEPLAKPAP